MNKEKSFAEKISRTFEAGVNLGDAHSIYSKLSNDTKKKLPPPVLQSFLGQVKRFCGRIKNMGEPTMQKYGAIFYPEFSTGKCFIKYKVNEKYELTSFTVKPYTHKIPEIEVDADLGFDEKIKKLSKHYFDHGQLVGMAIGVLEGDKIQYFVYGHHDFSKNKKIDESSVFEIGSLSKVYTGMLFAKQLHEKILKEDTRLGEVLKKLKRRKVKNITLSSLAFHNSGLPRLPESIPLNDPNPYQNYTKELLFKDLNKKNFKFKYDQNPKVHYSNLGVALLGVSLEKVLNKTYEDILNEDILSPLSLRNTSTNLIDFPSEQLTQGHTNQVKVPHWTFDSFKGAGGIYSSVSDVSKLVFELFDKNGKLNFIKNIMTSRQVNMSASDSSHMGLFKRKASPDSNEYFWHNGGTAGYSSFLGYDVKNNRGVVILSNVFDAPMTELGFKILD